MRQAVKRYHDAGIKTALVSNSWNEDDYDVDLHAMFDVVVLSQALKIRKPGPGDLRSGARTPPTPRTSLCVRR